MPHVSCSLQFAAHKECKRIVRLAFDVLDRKRQKKIAASELKRLLVYVSYLFKWWPDMLAQGVDRKDILSVSARMGADKDAARDFVARLDNAMDLQVQFCRWMLEQMRVDAPSRRTAGSSTSDVAAVFEDYAQDGAVDQSNTARMLDALRVHRRQEPYEDVREKVCLILAHKAAGVTGAPRINREQFEKLDECIQFLREGLWDSTSRRNWMHSSRTPFLREVGPTVCGLDKAFGEKSFEITRKLQSSDPKCRPESDTSVPAAVEYFEANAGESSVTFGELCSWLVNRELGNGKALSFRDTTPTFETSLKKLSTKKLYRLGLQYKRGENPIPKNAVSAAACFCEAAERGHAASQRLLGECLMAGEGLTKDATEAVRLYRLAEQKDDTIARTHLGLCYLTGEGVAKDAGRAVGLFERAGDDAVAQFNLGVCFFRGQGVEEDTTRAVKLYEKAAKQGLMEAQCNLGECLMQGVGIERNPKRAAQLFMQAARRGLAAAQYNLGICYSRGEGVAPNEAEGLRYLQLAKAQRHRRAIVRPLWHALPGSRSLLHVRSGAGGGREVGRAGAKGGR